MDKWLGAALDYIPAWLDYQMRMSEQPGCVIAVARGGQVLLERAFGHADAIRRLDLTPRHRFRVASHSKSFTAAAVMKLREAGKLRLDDAAGRYIGGLHKTVARVTIAQLLSHSAGIIRDGLDNGQWQGRRPFLSRDELRAALAEPQPIAANTRFKYSNHGFGLAGLIIEKVADEDYAAWMKREIIAAAGLEETTPDWPIPRGAKLAMGHSGLLPLGRRVTIPGDVASNAIGPAGGFIGTAADLARFFGQIDPNAKRAFLSVESRREMIRRQWRDPHASLERYYGLGIMSGTTHRQDWFGHGGAFPGYITRTGVLPKHGLTVSVLTNAIDGWANLWFDGALAIIAAFARHGAPKGAARGWKGRWWGLWGAADLVAMGERVLVGTPGFINPFMDASEIAIEGRDRGRIALANGFASHGEQARLVRGKSGKVLEVQLAGLRLFPEARVAAEVKRRYA